MNLTRLKLRIILVLLFFLVSVAGCMGKIPYEPEQLARFHARKANVELPFTTEQGRQTAFYVPPHKNPDDNPAAIAILYPGINSTALGWLNLIEIEETPRLGYLLIDYPGRGRCEGSLHPEYLYKNTQGALAVLAKRLGPSVGQADLRVLGHSFGSGAALQYAARDNRVSRILLVAPFNDLKEAVALKSSFLAFMMPAQIDNRQLIAKILSRDAPADIMIIHGSGDQSLPVDMGRELAAMDREQIRYREVPGGGHSDVLHSRRKLIFDYLNGHDPKDNQGSFLNRVSRRLR